MVKQPTGAPLIRVAGLKLHFDEGKTRALNGVDIAITQGEFVAIVGPSGSGKSSLLNVLGTLDVPTAGELYFAEQSYANIKDLSLFRRNNFGFIFQGFHLIPTLTALDNVIVPTIGCGGDRASYQAHAVQLLRDLGLSERLQHFPNQLSGGERQRVAIARALINQPRVILADEPTGSLDSANAVQVLDTLTSIVKQQGLTLIMVTHDERVSMRADRIIHMRDGKVEATAGAGV